MSEDWCHGIDKRLDDLSGRIIELEHSNSQLVRVVVVGLLAIVSAVVGAKLV